MPDTTAAALPGWDEMSDLDKGAALLHLHKREWEGEEYAVENYPARYFDDPRLTSLSPPEASRHAASLGRDEDKWTALGEAGYERLYDAALAADRRRGAGA